MFLPLFLNLLQQAYSGITLGSQDSFDPGVLSWSKTTWVPSPIYLETSNAGSTTQVTVFAHTETSLNLGVLCVSFPTGFVVSSSCVSDITVDEDMDFSVTFDSVVLPSSVGIYGPVKVYTATSETGNIYDLNTNFATILITAKASTGSGLDISAENTYVQSKTAVLVTFTIKEDMWEHDSVIIEYPQSFSVSNPTCESISDSDTLYLVGPNGMPELMCIVESDIIHIYGIGNDILLDSLDSTSLTLKIKISGFTTPNVAFSTPNLPTWNLYTKRLNHIIETYTKAGPTLAPKVLSITSFSPKISQTLISGLTTYMVLSFTLSCSIPTTGTLSFTFTGLDLAFTSWKKDASQLPSSGTTSYYSLSTSISSECTITQTSLSCASFTSIMPSGTYTLTIYPKFTSSTSSVVIETSDGGYSIERSAAYSKSLSAVGTMLTYGHLKFSVDNTGTYSAATGSDVIGYFCIKSPVSIPLSTEITLNLPYSLGAGDMKITAESTIKGNMLKSSTQIDHYYDETLTSLQNPTASEGKIVISLAADTQIADYIYIYLTSDDIGTLPAFTLPYASSDISTNYEYTVSITVDSKEYIYAGPLTILVSSVVSITKELLCTTSFEGLPYEISFMSPYNFQPSSGSLYISIDFEGFDDDLGSGLNIGDTYPLDTDLTGVVLTLGTGNVIMQGLVSLDSTTTYNLKFPIGPKISSVSAKINVYFITSNVEHLVLSSDLGLSMLSSITHFLSATVATYVNSVSATPKPLETFSLEIQPKSSNTVNTGYLGVIFPAGVTFSSPSVYKSGSPSTTTNVLYSFGSSDNNFAFPGIFYELNSDFYVSSSSTTAIISGIVAPLGGFTGDVYVYFVAAGTKGSSCNYLKLSINPTITFSPYTFTESEFTPSSISARGPNSILTNVTSKLTMPINIPSSSIIVFTLNWDLSVLSTFSISGITDCDLTKNDNIITIVLNSDLTSSSIITFTAYNLLPPITTSDDYQFTSIKIFTDNSLTKTIVSYSGLSDKNCQVSGASSKGLSYFTTVNVLPNGIGLVGTYLYLEFSLTHSLPKKSIISINSASGSWTSLGDIKESCWFTLDYSHCQASVSSIDIVLAEEYIEYSKLTIVIDNAFTLPSTSGSTSKGFTVTTSFEGTVLDYDNPSAPSSMQKLTVNALPDSTISQNNDVYFTPTGKYELASYVFNFTSDAIVSLTYSIYLVFPKNFDPYLGGGYKKYPSGDPTGFYLDCDSDTKGMSKITCKVDHWIVYINGITDNIQNGTIFTINLHNIRTPSSIGSIGVYILNSNGKIITYNKAFNVADPQAFPSNIEIKSLTGSVSSLRSSSVYTLETYLPILSIGDEIIINFPEQYYLIRDNKATISCSGSSSTWQESSGNCNVYDGYIILEVTNELTQSELATLVFTVNNPEWGFEDIDEKYAFGDLDFWTGKIEIIVASGNNYNGRSYGQHYGYIGLREIKLPILINNYNAMTKSNHIVIKPGTLESNIQIKVDYPLKADKIQLTPNNSAVNTVELKFYSSKNYTITKDMTTIEFSVGVASNAKDSMNYIEWTVSETSLNGTSLYAVNYKTLVEVYDSDDIVLELRSVDQTICNVPIGYLGPLIEIYAPKSPVSDLSISFALLNSSLIGVSFSPSSVTFVTNEQYKYFQIQLNSTFNGGINGGPYQYSFTMTGADVLAYKQISVAEFYAYNNIENVKVTIESLSFTQITQTSASISIKTDSSCLVYWEFCPYNTLFSSYGELVDKVYPLTSQNSTNLKLDTQISNYLLGLRYKPRDNESWKDFQKKMYAYNLEYCFYSAVFVSASTSTEIFAPYFLWAETEYKIQAFAVNVYGNTSETWTYETTKTMPEPIQITMTITGINNYEASEVGDAISTALGINSKRFSITKSSRRHLITTVVGVLNVDRSSATSPDTLYTNIDSDLLTALLNDVGYSLSKEIIKQSSYKISSGMPEIIYKNLNSITLTSDANENGQICCVAEVTKNFTSDITDMQVYLGIDRDNINAMSNCTDLDVNMTIVINGLSAATGYNISCIYVSEFPVWPSMSEIYEMYGITEVANNDFSTSGMAWIVVAIGFLVLA
ncbi:hypothetical protein SteCoe_16546 [Stentor coeruleus]|uniref:GPS domain-containing protein n=1 Tax=Stentor coeruleus TaxID=5963 RepID=A0A1R2C0Y8_9CILI|nr:hypothetical protein SteCoe_16546 [Stentor coeruleus]